ncbi:A24 family peptidase [Kitasatospora sp. GP82]|uniref:A24 family peptidase n=1 Tax=Kitasatospora sp. GP82 TaxID=3035089 RepID=UPI002475D9FD|nr:A24 family peptidase [Kitasatospora sp. GP82]MDH6123143.1 leader peptidase (prepilin peptidase)/N-methyltransferase [Kitasatospora sp. GP82]
MAGELVGTSAGAVAGVLAAPLLRAAAARYAVPYGEPWRERSAPGGPALLPVGLVAAGVGAAVGAAAQWPVALLLGWAGLFGVVLGFVDAAVHRLPDVLTLPLAVGTATLLLLTEHQGPVLLRCLYAALAFGACYGALALLAPMGFGDAKLAPALGAVLGWYGWRTVLAGFWYGFVLAALWGGAQLLTRRMKGGDSLPFGPCMLLGALLAVLAA